MNRITVQTKTTAEDYRKFIFFHLFLKKRIMPFLMIFAGAVSAAVVIAKAAGLIEIADWYFFVCLGFLGLILLQYFLFRFSVGRFLVSDQVVIDNERSVAIDESEITAEGGKEKGSGTYSWDMFFSAYETKKYFYLYINTLQTVILPKRDFKAEELPVLSALIREKLGRRFHKR